MKKPIKLAAYSYIVLLILGGVLGFLFTSSQFSLVSGLFYLVMSVLMFIVFNGFICLGKKLKSKFLVIVSWISIVLWIIYILYSLFGGFIINIPQLTEQDILALQNPNTSQDVISDSVYKLLTIILISHLVASIIFGVGSLLFGIALFKLRKRIKYAKAAGVLNIIAGATIFLFIGYLIAIPAMIMEIILLFDASKRFEKNKK